jgi:UDP-N-acetylglucosamine transferase subunit ALG13
LSRIASTAIVQWPEMLGVYRGAQLCKPALLSDVQPRRKPEGDGTFVAVGTHVQGFDRLLSAVDGAVENGLLPAPARGQSGESDYEASHLELARFMVPEQMDEAVARARYVVCHAGSGMISSALRAGRRPIVMPRMKAYGEHVDDHQLQIVTKLADAGLVVPLEGEVTAAHLAAADQPLEPASFDGESDSPSAIPDALVACLDALWKSAPRPVVHHA